MSFYKDNISEQPPLNCKKVSQNCEVKNENLQIEQYEDDQINEAENEPLEKQQCQLCSRSFNKMHQMIAHMRQHQGLKVKPTFNTSNKYLILFFHSHLNVEYVGKLLEFGVN